MPSRWVLAWNWKGGTSWLWSCVAQSSWDAPCGIFVAVGDKITFVLLLLLASMNAVAMDQPTMPVQSSWGELTGIGLLAALIVRETFRYLRDKDHETTETHRHASVEHLIPHAIYERLAALETRIELNVESIGRVERGLVSLSQRLDAHFAEKP